MLLAAVRAASTEEKPKTAQARKNSSVQLSIAGGVGGLAEALVVQPFDMLKSRYQLNASSRNPSVLAGLREVYREGGVLRFYRGMLPVRRARAVCKAPNLRC